MRSLILLFLSALCSRTEAQSPEDALRLSWFPQGGSARSLGIGGCMGSLGGDITAAFVNPAGLAQFRNPETMLSLGFSRLNTRSAYRDSVITNDKDLALPAGPWGIIFANSRKTGKKNEALSLAFCQKASLTNTIDYSGLNNYSSYSEQLAEEFAGSGYSIDAVLNSNSPLPYSAAPALYTYLIDTATVNGSTQVVGAPEYILNAGQAIRQRFHKDSRGGWYDLGISYAGTKDDKLLWGATLGIPLLVYRSNTVVTEQDTSSVKTNGFESFTYTDHISSDGVGLDLKAGVIYRPAEYIRIGLALHSPTFFSMTDKRSTSLNTNLESDSGTIENYSVDSRSFTNGKEGESKYMQTTPFRALLSASYVFREEEDIKRQRGFLTADIEYVAHGGSRFHSDNEEPTDEEKAYYRQLNKVIKDQYRGAFNFRVGGEVKFNIIMARLGFSYYSNPYKERSAFKADQMLFSGGLGYRDRGFYIDAGYSYQIIRDASFPYRLADRLNTFASTRQIRGNFMITAGFKL
jgi:hypothetical protein